MGQWRGWDGRKKWEIPDICNISSGAVLDSRVNGTENLLQGSSKALIRYDPDVGVGPTPKGKNSNNLVGPAMVIENR